MQELFVISKGFDSETYSEFTGSWWSQKGLKLMLFVLAESSTPDVWLPSIDPSDEERVHYWENCSMRDHLSGMKGKFFFWFLLWSEHIQFFSDFELFIFLSDFPSLT